MVVSTAAIHLLYTKHYYKFNTIFLDFPWIHILVQQKVIICNCLIHIGEYVALHHEKKIKTKALHICIKAPNCYYQATGTTVPPNF